MMVDRKGLDMWMGTWVVDWEKGPQVGERVVYRNHLGGGPTVARR